MSDVIELLRGLVSISSISSESNRGVIALAQQILSGAGWSYEEYAYHDAHDVEKVNLIAWPGPASPRLTAFHLALVCHTDTVPYSSEWIEATTLTEDGGDLKGCGACDVKGFLACILAAASELDPSRLRKPLAIVLTADEEIGCIGARHLVDREALSARYAIVGEPTSLHPVSGGKGYCLAELTVVGREAHSAFPDKGRSAIYGAARLIVEIEKIATELQEFRLNDFSPPWTTINVGEIRGGLAKNIVPPFCRFLLEWRPIPGQSAELVPGLVKAAIARLAKADHAFHCKVEVLRMQDGFALHGESELLAAMVRASGNTAETVAFGTEAPWLNKLGAEAVVFGPGSMLSAHSPREFVPVEELLAAVRILKATIHDLCS